MSNKFVHLHCHTSFSLLDGALRIPKLLEWCKNSQMSSAAITDNATMYGAINFYLKAKSAGINPIIGCEIYLVPDLTLKTKGFDRLILLAKDYEGYQNLIKLVSISNLEGFYYRPRLDMKHLEEYCKGLVVISPGMFGPIATNIRENREPEAIETAKTLKEIYKDDFYLGIQRLGRPFEDVIIEESKKMGQELDIPLVVTNDIYYPNRDSAYIKDILTCIRMGKILDQDTRYTGLSQEAYLKTPEEMEALFTDYPQAIENTVKIAEKCHIEIETEQVHLPRFDCPDNLSSKDYLEKLTWEGIDEKYGDVTPEIKKRVEFELGIINKMDYAPYFLIINDFLDYCELKKIPVGPGRGSAAGSIIAYALNITRIDPLKYNLLFERFLNPERVSMPDVDLDFCIRRRGEVIDYIIQKYGKDCVAQIVTFGSMAARGVIRDVGRVLNVPLSDVDRIAKLIPSSPGQYTSIPEALEQVSDLKKMYEEKEEFKELIDIGAQLEGQERHTSTHAAGIVISRDPLTTVVPLIKNEGQIATQYPMGDLEKIGLLKMDILGLRNLTVIKDSLDLIREFQKIDLDIETISIEDKATYKLLCKGYSIGIFQLESQGMRGLIKDLKPQNFEDIIALLALYRPGPLGSGMVSEFISNKSGKTKVKYDLKELEPILKETYGMIVYQEQVMQIASTVGGFTLGQADMLRRAMGKKKKDVMENMRKTFMEGAEKKKFPAKKAEKIFELCYKFAEYGFNKSHSAAYAMISYQTAFLKANYPAEYMTALISSVAMSSDKVSLYIQECKRMGLDVYPPSINASRSGASIDKGGVRFGLGAIKNVGEGAIENIVENRLEDGGFKSLADFCLRVDLRQVNKRVVESLIKSGAMDDLGDRSQLLAVYERTLESAQTVAKERSNGQVGLFINTSFGEGIPEIPTDGDYEEIPNQEKMRWEKDLLGLYMTGHPLEDVRKKIEKLPYNTQKITAELENKSIMMAGLLKECRTILTKNKTEMCLGRLEDFYGDIQLVVFPGKTFEQFSQYFEDDNIIYVKGKVRTNQNDLSIIVEEIELIEQIHANRKLHIDVKNIDDLMILQEIKNIGRQNKGSLPLCFHIGDTTVEASRKYWISENELCIKQIENLIGTGGVWMV